MPPQVFVKRFLAPALAAATLAIVSPHALAASLTICNNGAVDLYAATGTWENEGFLLLGRSWYVSGWYPLPKRECRTLYEGSARLYFVLTFTDSTGHWGSMLFEPERKDPWQSAKHALCVSHGEFQYKLDDENPAACPRGYARLTGTLVFEPGNYGSYTLDVAINKDDPALPLGFDELASNNAAAPTRSAASATGDVLAPLIGIAAAIGVAAADAQSSAAPKPFAEGTFNASLFGVPIVRRNGEDTWFTNDARRVDPVYLLNGQQSSPLLDAPKQHAGDDTKVSAAVVALNRGLASISANRQASVTPEGRLKYDFQLLGGTGLERRWVNLEALDFGRGQRLSGNGVEAFRIPCRDARPCVVAVEQQGGEQSKPLLFDELEVFFLGRDAGDDVWAALRTLHELFPEPPAVIAR